MLHQVGAGTLGPVYRAHDAVEGRLVAIKAFTLDLVPERAVELVGALNTLVARNLSHPSIAAPIAAGLEGSVPWLAQEYVPAESLDVALRQYGPPPAAETLELITNLAGALDFAAAALVLHGALHPRDVLVAPEETHVVDLGVAAALEQIGIRPPVRRPYSAPEQVAGGPVTRAGDIYALGAIAWEVLTGQRLPAPGAIDADMLPPLAGVDRPALARAFASVTADDPAARPSSALEFARAVRAAITDLAALEAAMQATAAASAAASAAPGELGEHPAAPQHGAGPLDDEPPVPAAFEDRQGFSADAEPGGPMESPVAVAVPHSSGATDEPPRTDTHDDFALFPTLVPVEPNPWDRAPVSADDGEHDLSTHAWRPPRHVEADEPSLRGGPSWRIIATLLIVGITLGFSAAYMWLGRSGREPAAQMTQGQPPAAPATDSTAAPQPAQPAPPQQAQDRTPGPREFTDNAVPESPKITSGPVDTAPRASAPAAGNRASSNPPDASSRKETPRPARGQLIVQSRPSGAVVEVNGRRRGDTPLTVSDLPFGGYRLRVTREGYEPEQRRVTLTAGRSSATVDVPMRRTRAAAPEPQPARPEAASRSSEGGFVGSVLVESRPSGARVFIDGKFVGTTPLSVTEVSAGSHVVRMEMAGYNRWSSAVRVVTGERVRVAASLEEEIRR